MLSQIIKSTQAMEDTLLYTILSFIFIFFAFKFFLKNKTKTPYKNLPPGPPSLPIVGHLHLLKHPVHRTFCRLSQKYGTVFSLWFGSRRVVIVSSPSTVRECFTKNESDIILANRPHLLIGKLLQYNNTTMVTARYGDHWRNLRRIGSTEIFSSRRLNIFLGIRKDEVKRLLLKLAQNSVNDFKKVEMKSLLSELAFNVIMRMVAGKRYYGDEVTDEEEARQFREIIKEGGSYAITNIAGEFLPFLNWIRWSDSYENRLWNLGNRTDRFLQGLIDEHRNRKESRNSMIDHLLSLQQSQPEYYTDQIIKGLIQVLLIAGTDTSSVTLEWALSNLLNHPDILTKARIELDEQIGQQQLVDEPDVSKLPYLRSIIFETLRLYPAAPLLFPHYSSADCEVGGYDVPHDTIVLINAWAIHRDPELWEDPESFKPERFEVGDHHEDHDQVQKLLPFGIGRRACPGAGLAQRIIGLTLGSLIQCFEWKKVSEEEIDMSEGIGTTMPKVGPLEVMCKARPIMNHVLLESIDKIYKLCE